MQILLAILAFGFLIMVHELGHFITAKRGGIQVNEFWLGMGPALFTKEIGGTLYCLRLLPFGGACVMEGEDADSSNPRSFAQAKMSRRILVITAGALMNFAAGFLILLAVIGFSKSDGFVSTTIQDFREGFAYQGESMLLPGDQILKIDGYQVFTRNDINTGLDRGAGDGKFDFVVRRNGQRTVLRDVPLSMQFDGGTRYGINFAVTPKNAGTVLENTFWTAVNLGRLVWDSLGQLVTGQVGVDQLSGPVGVADAMVQQVKSSFSDFLVLVAFISINLGVMNLLPLPALDGGRLVFLIIEAVRGKPVPAKYEGYVHGAGLVLLLTLMVYVTGQDIWRLITG